MKERIRKLRKLLELSQAEFAHKIGVNPSTVSVWERDGKVPELKINEICRVYGINKEWLLTGKGQPTAPNDEEIYKETVGSRLRILRKKLGMTQTEFAARLKVSMQTIVSWEKDGAIPQAKKELIVASFNVNEKWLDSGVGEMFLQTNEPSKQFETAREFAVRNGCDEITSLIFERFMELPETDKRAFEILLSKLLTQKVRDTSDKKSSVEDSADSSSIYRDVYTISNTTFNQNNYND